MAHACRGWKLAGIAAQSIAIPINKNYKTSITLYKTFLFEIPLLF